LAHSRSRQYAPVLAAAPSIELSSERSAADEWLGCPLSSARLGSVCASPVANFGADKRCGIPGAAGVTGGFTAGLGGGRPRSRRTPAPDESDRPSARARPRTALRRALMQRRDAGDRRARNAVPCWFCSPRGLLQSAARGGEPAWVLRRYELSVAYRPQSCRVGCPVRPVSSSAMASVIALG
jgi:hypothetical protein